MFGFLHFPSNACCLQKKTYRQIYAAICSWQRQKFGVKASLLISYEAVFLYQLGVDADLLSPPTTTTPTCCRFRNDWKNNWGLVPEAAQFVSAFALLLARVKIEDDIRDSGGIVPRSLRWLLKPSFARSTDYFRSLDADTLVIIDQSVQQHLALETNNFQGSPDDYCEPTASAFGFVFRKFAELMLASTQSTTCADLPDQFEQVGRGVGGGIIASDCVADFEKDKRRGEFNPIRSNQDFDQYQTAALKSFADAGWISTAITEGNNGNSTTVLRAAFDRVDALKLPRITNASLSSDYFASKTRQPSVRRLSARAGVCDCACPCDDACCPCDDACCSGDDVCCSGADCCSVVDCCNGSKNIGCSCDCCFAPCDVCAESFTGGRRRPPESLTPYATIVGDPLIGQTGHAECPLNPTGYVIVNDQKYPAKTEGVFIETGTQVTVIGDSTFGIVVEPADPRS